MTGLAPRTSGSEIHRQDVETVCKWLTKAIEIIGAGAKTATAMVVFKKIRTVRHDGKIKPDRGVRSKSAKQRQPGKKRGWLRYLP